MKPIYLDYNATTPILLEVIEAMAPYWGQDFGNPSSDHAYGQAAVEAIKRAREQVATAVGCSPEELTWTSGATEANNLAIFGAARFYSRKGRHLVTCATEHKAVLDVCKQLEREGYELTILTPMKSGIITAEQLSAAIRPDTVLVSIMHANSETGVIQDLKTLGQIVRERGALFHVDAAQSVGKIEVNLAILPVDLMSFSSHKSYGPKGVGALYVRHQPRVRLQPVVFGGGQEQGLRPGTLPTPNIVGMGAAFARVTQDWQEESARQNALIQRLWRGLQDLPGIQRNGDPIACLPNTLNVSFAGIKGPALRYACGELALSSTSACATSRLQPSHVLIALGLLPELALASLRFSVGRMTTIADIDRAIAVVSEQLIHCLNCN